MTASERWTDGTGIMVNMVSWQVWVHVETEITRAGEVWDHYSATELPFGPTASFGTEAEAVAFATRLHTIGGEQPT